MAWIRWAAVLGAGGALAAHVGGCGYPDFKFASESTGSTGATGAAGTGGTSSASHATATGSSGSGSGSGTSGSGGMGGGCTVQHAGGGDCEFLPGLECGCTAPKKCSIAPGDEATGKSSCVFKGPQQSFTKCSTDGDCDAGAWCNHSTSACQPICLNTTDCASLGGGRCEQALMMDGKTAIPDLKVCAAHCDLITASPCGAGLNCVYQDAVMEFECVNSKGVKESDPCTTDADCTAPFGCNYPLTSTHKKCLRWCAPAGMTDFTCTNNFCSAFSPPIKKSSTVDYGVCN